MHDPPETSADERGALRPGRWINANLCLIRLLGQGGMGSVWVARHETLDTEVAVKFVSAGLDKQEELQKRFKREARIAAKIKSPHVVEVYDSGRTDDGLPYIVMELLAGESLAEKLCRDRRLIPEEAIALMAHVAEALTEAHALDVVHRDIKPHNIFLVQSKTHVLWAKVLDFGIAKNQVETLDATATAVGSVVGTPLYMSPDQLLESKPATPQSDLWSLAVVLYEALTGRLPFEGLTAAALGASLAKRACVAPSVLRPELGDEVDAWFAKAFEPDAADRFHAATEMAETFREAIEASPTIVMRSSGELPMHGDVSTPISQPSPGSAKSMRTLDGSARALGGSQSRLGGRAGVLALVFLVGGGIVLAGAMGLGALGGPEPPAGEKAAASAGSTAAPRRDVAASTQAPDPATTPSLGASAVASSAPSVAEVQARGPAVQPRPASASVPALSAMPKPSGPPAYCADPKQAFVVDDKGIHHLKPECR